MILFDIYKKNYLFNLQFLAFLQRFTKTPLTLRRRNYIDLHKTLAKNFKIM